MQGVWFRSPCTVILVILVLSLSFGTVQAAPLPQEATPTPVIATVAVERAVVLPFPDRASDPLLYLYERERVLVLGQSIDGVFLYVPVDNLYGWVVSAQFDIEGDLATVPFLESNAPLPTPTMTITPFGFGTEPPAAPAATAEPGTFPTRTPLPTRTPTLSASRFCSGFMSASPTSSQLSISENTLTWFFPHFPPPITPTYTILPVSWVPILNTFLFQKGVWLQQAQGLSDAHMLVWEAHLTLTNSVCG